MQEVARHVDSFSPRRSPMRHVARWRRASPICCIDGKAIRHSMAQSRTPCTSSDLNHATWVGSCELFLSGSPEEPLLDPSGTSPPYNIGKEYETRARSALCCSSRVAKRAVRRRQWAGLGSNNRVDTVRYGREWICGRAGVCRVPDLNYLSDAERDVADPSALAAT